MFEKVGGERTVNVDMRVISATNKPLKTEMHAGRFRQDLYYRLNVVPIHMPPLKGRPMDIPLLAQHFLNLAATSYQRQPMVFTDKALSAMLDYDWPGYVRELQNAVHLSFVRSHGSVIDIKHLPLEIQEKMPAEKTCRLDAQRVVSALDHCGGNKSRAARYLGVGRATLYRFLAATPKIKSKG
jgi:DNA-binding NtrC family response regulator